MTKRTRSAHPHFSARPSAAIPQSDSTPDSPPVSSSASKPSASHALTLRFVDIAAEHPEFSEREAGVAAGYRQPKNCRGFFAKYAKEIEETRVRKGIVRQMELDEVLRGLAGVARQSDDLKVAHSALRTLAEIHGALGAGKISAQDRGTFLRQIEEMVGRMKGRLKKGQRARVRMAAEVEISGNDDSELSVTGPPTMLEIASKPVDKG